MMIVAAAAAVTATALTSVAAPLLCPIIGRRTATLAALPAPFIETLPTRGLAVAPLSRLLPRLTFATAVFNDFSSVFLRII